MTDGPRRRRSRAFTLRTKPVSSGASSSTSTICAPWTTRSKIMCHIASTSEQRHEGDKDEAEIAPDGEKLEQVEPFGDRR